MQHGEVRCGAYELHVQKKLAEGGFGLIFLVTDSHSGRELVLKRCSINRQESYDIVKKEVSMLKRFAGPHVVQLLASEVNTRSGSDALLLLELCPSGHLLERLQARNGELLPEGVVNRIFGQILLGLKPMHESRPPVVHRDLKLENILFGSDQAVRICDFGSCVDGYVSLRDAGERSAAEEVISKETTQMYRAPEMIDLFMRPRLTEKSDIWALGCIYFALCFLTHPFQDAGSLGILGAKIVMPPSGVVSRESRALIMRMLDFDPEARPSVGDLLTWLGAIASGNALPDWEPSPEVLLRRQERELAEQRRAEKNAKKVVAPAVTHRRVPDAPLDSNSVAARRLAAKRGQPVGQPRVQSDFADFGSVEAPASFSSSASRGGGEDAGGFSDWAFPPAAASSPAFASDAGFDAFGSSAAGVVDNVGASLGPSDGFDAFSGGAQQQQQQQQPFAQEDGFSSQFSAFAQDGGDDFPSSEGGGFSVSQDAFGSSAGSAASGGFPEVGNRFESTGGGHGGAFGGSGFDAADAFDGPFDSRSRGDGFESPAFASSGSEGGFREFGSLPPSESNRNSMERDQHEVTERLAAFAPFGEAEGAFEPFDSPAEAFAAGFEDQQSGFDAFGNSPVRTESVFDAPTSSSSFAASSSSSFAASSSSYSPSPFSSSASDAFASSAAPSALPEEDILGVFDSAPRAARPSPAPSPRLDRPASASARRAPPSDSINLIDSPGPEQDLLGPAVGYESPHRQSQGQGQGLDLLGNLPFAPAHSYAADLLEAQVVPSSVPTLQPRANNTPDQVLSLFDQPKPDPFNMVAAQGPGAGGGGMGGMGAMGAMGGMGMNAMANMGPQQQHQHQQQQHHQYQHQHQGRSPLAHLSGSSMGAAPPLPPMLMGMVASAQANLSAMQSPPLNPFRPMGGQPMGQQPMGQMGQAGTANTGGKLQPTRGLQYPSAPGARDPFDTLSSFPKQP